MGHLVPLALATVVVDDRDFAGREIATCSPLALVT
jgi:hypothetical protein